MWAIPENSSDFVKNIKTSNRKCTLRSSCWIWSEERVWLTKLPFRVMQSILSTETYRNGLQKRVNTSLICIKSNSLEELECLLIILPPFSKRHSKIFSIVFISTYNLNSIWNIHLLYLKVVWSKLYCSSSKSESFGLGFDQFRPKSVRIFIWIETSVRVGRDSLVYAAWCFTIKNDLIF